MALFLTKRGVSATEAEAIADAEISAATIATSQLSGTVATARLGSGTANSGTYLRGDSTWAAVSGAGGEGDVVYPSVTVDSTGAASANLTAINAAITTANGFTNGGKVVIAKSGVVWINGPILMRSNVWLCGLGQGTIVKLTNAADCHMIQTIGHGSATAMTNVKISDLWLDGNMANQTNHNAAGTPNAVDQYYGINLRNTSKSVFERLWVRNVFRSAIYMYGNDNVIRYNDIRDIGTLALDGGGDTAGSDYENGIIGRQGIQCDETSLRPIIHGNYLENILEHGIKVYPGSTGARITDNYVKTAKNFGIYVQDTDNAHIAGNTCEGCWQTGVYVGGSSGSDNHVVGNSVHDTVSHNATQQAFTFVNTTNTLFAGNKASNSGALRALVSNTAFQEGIGSLDGTATDPMASGHVTFSPAPWFYPDVPGTSTVTLSRMVFNTTTAVSFDTTNQYKAPAALHVIGIVLHTDADRTAGTARAYVNGGNVGGVACQLDGTNTEQHQILTTHAAGLAVAAGATITVTLDTTGWTPTTANAWVELILSLD